MRVIWIAFTDVNSPFNMLSGDLVASVIRWILHSKTPPLFNYGTACAPKGDKSRRARSYMSLIPMLDNRGTPLHFELSYNSQSSHPVIVYEPGRAPFASRARFSVKVSDPRVVSFLDRMDDSNRLYAEGRSAEYTPSLRRHRGDVHARVKLLDDTRIVHGASGRTARESDLTRDRPVRIVVKPKLWAAHKTMGTSLRATHIIL